jgi:hypothetical protein
MNDLLHQFWENFQHNLFKPLLLFFYAGFLVPILRVKLEFPKAVYQGLTIYLLLAIGWHGGEELAGLESYGQALGFMVIGFITNTIIGFLAYFALRAGTRLRKVDAATVAGYYGSDSAGTFVTAQGVLMTAGIASAAYMPVMLAVMEIPGCLVALYLVSRLRRSGMDTAGYMPSEMGYNKSRKPIVVASHHDEHGTEGNAHRSVPQERLAAVSAGTDRGAAAYVQSASGGGSIDRGNDGNGSYEERREAVREEAVIALESDKLADGKDEIKSQSWLNPEMLHEVFLNPGIFLLFAGIAIGFIGRLQGAKVTDVDDTLFVTLFHGMLCVFLLEMGMTASSKLKDLRKAGWQFVLFALIAPNVFATCGMLVAHGYSVYLKHPFDIGTYVLFGVLCGASSYIAVPAVQRLAIPEASPTLPLAASLGVTFSYNVTIGIPVYILIATMLTKFAAVSG